jgi:hypothetical protein
MTDDQHDHDPEVPVEPDVQQAAGADQEDDEMAPPQLRHIAIREFSAEFEKATGWPASGIAMPGVYAAAEALRQVLDSPSQRLFQESVSARLSPTLAAAATALNNLDLRYLMPGGVLSRNEAFRLAGSTLWENVQDVDPENWRGERLRRLDMLAVLEEGIPLVWIPSADVIRELLDALDAPARRKVLERQAPTVAEDCRTVLTDVVRTDLASEVGFLHDCLDSIDNGTYPAAQVLASSILDTLLRAMVRANPHLQNNKGGFTFSILAAQLPKATPDTQVGQFRAYCVNTGIHKAYEPYFGPPVPEGYNRHATAHAAGPTQITLPNALTAVMLAVGLVRELEETQLPLSPAG